ncbi:hypothetical protein [Streptomyces zaomyceticus]|uniref:hypothetical protein n=1 Tax=Streptomyces zaomyceticus TaxID=68286 RepID=UPI0037A41F3F
MTTPETRARLGALEQQLTTPTPAPLDGQTSLTLDWVCPPYDQETLWPTRNLLSPTSTLAPEPTPARTRGTTQCSSR